MYSEMPHIDWSTAASLSSPVDTLLPNVVARPSTAPLCASACMSLACAPRVHASRPQSMAPLPLPLQRGVPAACSIAARSCWLASLAPVAVARRFSEAASGGPFHSPRSSRIAPPGCARRHLWQPPWRPSARFSAACAWSVRWTPRPCLSVLAVDQGQEEGGERAREMRRVALRCDPSAHCSHTPRQPHNSTPQALPQAPQGPIVKRCMPTCRRLQSLRCWLEVCAGPPCHAASAAAATTRPARTRAHPRRGDQQICALQHKIFKSG